jgi:hypothetical protein
MGYASQDDMIAKISAGAYLRRDVAKLITPVGLAGQWNCSANLNGSPNITTYPSAADLTWVNCSELAGEGTSILGIQHGGNPGGSPVKTKHILNVGAMIVAAAGAPWQAKLVDLQGYYTLAGATNLHGTGSRVLINSESFTASDSGGHLLLTTTSDWVTGTKVRFTAGGGLPTGLLAATDYWLTRINATTKKVSTSFDNMIAGTFVAYSDAVTASPANILRIEMPRYENGVGCEAFFVVQAAPTAGGPALTASAYDNTTSTPGAGTRAFQGSPTLGAAAAATVPTIPHSGNAAGRYGPFLPKQGGDLGIARINSFTLGATAYTTGGKLALCICRPLLDIAIPVTGMWSERDLVNQLMSMPKVEDGACLVWLYFATGATTNNSPFNATIDFGWA